MSEYIIKQIAAASVPNAPVGAFTLFLDTDGNWKKKDENGVVSLVAGVTDKNLEQVLTVGNSTGNNDIIVQDNKVIKSSTGDTIMSFGSNTMTINAGSFATDVSVSNVSMNSLGTSMSLFKSDFSKIGFFQVIENSTGNQTTGPLPNYPVVSGSQNSTINQNVINTSINGGNNIIAKTNNTDYSNQNGYNTGTAGELIVNHTPSATDRTQTHQDADGTIALLSDILDQFNVNLDSSDSSVSRVFSGGRTIFSVTHNLGTLDLKPEVFRLSDGRNIGFRIERTGVNTVDISRNGNIADGLFRLLI